MTLEPQPLAPALAAAEEAGWTTLRLDLDGVRSKAGLMARCGEALRLPEWVGGNWDALADALRDLSWLPGAAGRLVAVTSWRGYAGERAGEWETFVEVLEEAVDFWRKGGRGEVGFAVVLALPEAGGGPVVGAPPRAPRLKRRRG
ncbi:barstar family protein [Streptomyces yangpuensis]|uniref:barstar family protein n=1 Tax=Streptomyces yangpuensis TaxID=1648182 RepID=UPI000629A52B|nr:barstar family protein [Streptomyces yangpuensis]